jgi:hypothetical protein
MRQDLRYAWRNARRAPSFVLTAVIALALGIGASTAVFTVVNAVLLRPLPFVESTQLAMIRPTSGSRVSDAYVYEWRRQTRTFRDIAAWYDARVNLTGAENRLKSLPTARHPTSLPCWARGLWSAGRSQLDPI